MFNSFFLFFPSVSFFPFFRIFYIFSSLFPLFSLFFHFSIFLLVYFFFTVFHFFSFLLFFSFFLFLSLSFFSIFHFSLFSLFFKPFSTCSPVLSPFFPFLHLFPLFSLFPFFFCRRSQCDGDKTCQWVTDMCPRRRCSGNRKVFWSVPSRAMATATASSSIVTISSCGRSSKHLPLKLADALEKAELLDPAVLRPYQTYSAEELGLVNPGDKEQGPVCVSGTISSVFPCPGFCLAAPRPLDLDPCAFASLCVPG